MPVGFGFDIHPFTDDPGRRLVLGGVHITGFRGLAGHSDADPVAHAIADAVLGAAGLGDLGGLFPDTDPTWSGADSIDWNFGIPDKDLEDGKDGFRAMLWSKRFKATAGRLALLEILDKEKIPLSVVELVKKLPDQNQASIYRALEALVKARLVIRINSGKAHASYEVALGRIHHHHAVCTSCGLVEDIVNCDSQELNVSARAQLKKFKSIESHSLEFFGLCKKCEETAK